MNKEKHLTMDQHEQCLMVRALHEERKTMKETGVNVTAIEDLILRVIDAPEKKPFWRK